MAIKSRSGRVRGGDVDTVNSIVVGDGRRVVRYGAVVNMVAEVSRSCDDLGVLLPKHGVVLCCGKVVENVRMRCGWETRL